MGRDPHHENAGNKDLNSLNVSGYLVSFFPEKGFLSFIYIFSCHKGVLDCFTPTKQKRLIMIDKRFISKLHKIDNYLHNW